jgi:hypothetical protein
VDRKIASGGDVQIDTIQMHVEGAHHAPSKHSRERTAYRRSVAAGIRAWRERELLA